MSLYEPLFRHVLFPAYETVLKRRNTVKYLQAGERDQWLDRDAILAMQWRRLKALIEHCWNEVPYYRARWSEVGATPGDIRTLDDYARLPVLTKQDIIRNFEQLIAPSRRGELLYKTTGGSTGEPLRFGYTHDSYQHRVATMLRGYGWSGARPGQRTLYLWGQPLDHVHWKDRLYQSAFNRRTLNAFTMSESRMAEYADVIDSFRPEVIVSYVAPIVAMSDWLLANGRRIHRPQRILGAAERLHEAQRQVIEQAFGAPAYNTYGCREFMLIAAECERREGLHVNADQLVVELGSAQCQTVGDAPGDEQPRDLIITDLNNYGMPFLRYVNGDMATASTKQCSCGRGLPMLSRVDGRRLDALRTADGRFVPGEFIVHSFLGATGVKRFQVVQRELDALDLTVVRGEGFDPVALEHVIEHLRRGIGEQTTIRLHFSEAIPLTASGKHRVTISELA